MIIIGYEGIEHERFSHARDVRDLENSQNLVWFDDENPNTLELAKLCKEAGIAYAVRVSSISALLIYAALGAKYAIVGCSKPLLQECQKIAEHYLLDTKILAVIEDSAQIEEAARMGIDGVIFRNVLG